MTVNKSVFPNLRAFEITSPEDRAYNCLAWAAGKSDDWWDPDQDYTWPDDLSRDYSITTLVMLYEGLGFDLCGNGDYEEGYEKVVLYGLDGEYEHAARQLADGRWTSKLGPDEDITHHRPEDLIGKNYGEIVCFLKRKVQ